MSKFEKSIEEHFTQPIIEEKLKVLKPTIDAQLNEQIGVMADLQLRQPGKPLYANISTLTTLYRVGEEEELAGLTVELISVDISAVKIEHSEASRIWVGSYLLARAPRDLTRTTYSVELEPLSKEQLRDILEEQIAREELGEANTSSTPEAQVAANRRRNELVTQLQQLDSP